MRELTFGYSPCPNDTFAFHALAHGLVEAPFTVRPVLLDIEELNRRAHAGEFHLTKLSVGAFAGVGEKYRLLRSGAALGEGVGPLVVTRPGSTASLPRAQRGGPPPNHNIAPAGPERVTDSSRIVPSRAESSRAESLADAVRGRVAIPGRETTAYRLLRLAAPRLGQTVEMRYDRILRAVETGEVDAGLIIHESRFTYQDHGLVKAADLGDWWEAETGLPVPLAGICARTDLPDELAVAAERAIRDSVRYAFDHPEASREYVQGHAQEMAPEVQRQHIALYVNEHSLDIGDEGMKAIARLVAAG